MPKRIILLVFGIVFTCCMTVSASDKPSDKPADKNKAYTAGCRPLLKIGADGEPLFATDCTQCIDCEVTSGNTCSASAICSSDPINCTAYGRCPLLGCSCTNNSSHIGCECDCTGNGVECSWTDSNNVYHDLVKNCPDNLP